VYYVLKMENACNKIQCKRDLKLMLQPENIESKLTEISVIINLGKFTASTKRAVTINAKQLSGLQETRWSMCCRQ
jgi:hypothetical protein